jgi:hypothetical protein
MHYRVTSIIISKQLDKFPLWITLSDDAVTCMQDCYYLLSNSVITLYGIIMITHNLHLVVFANQFTTFKT